MNPKHMEPALRIGKNGLSESVLEEVKHLLEKKGVIKVKFLKSFTETHDRKEEAKKLAEKTDSEFLSITGGSVLLKRK